MGTVKYKDYYKGAYYHIFNRGNQKNQIFLEDKDYFLYLKRLREYKEKYQVTLLAYCLMPNHIHWIARQDSEAPIYKLVSSLHTSYAMVFNKKYGKVGHLFQDRFKQKIIDDEDYLLHLSRYIHLNPVTEGIVEKPEDYIWSSYLDYIGARKGTLCDRGIVLNYFSDKDSSNSYVDFVKSSLNFSNISDLILEEELKDSPLF